MAKDKAVINKTKETIDDYEPLIKRLGLMGSKHLSEEFIAIAYNIEQAFIISGAKPGKDYTYKDLFQLAQPFVLHMFKKIEGFEYDYPADNVSSP
jgi:hypothetical protein